MRRGLLREPCVHPVCIARFGSRGTPEHLKARGGGITIAAPIKLRVSSKPVPGKVSCGGSYACRARRGNSQCLAKSSPCVIRTGCGAGAEQDVAAFELNRDQHYAPRAYGSCRGSSDSSHAGAHRRSKPFSSSTSQSALVFTFCLLFSRFGRPRTHILAKSELHDFRLRTTVCRSVSSAAARVSTPCPVVPVP